MLLKMLGLQMNKYSVLFFPCIINFDAYTHCSIIKIIIINKYILLTKLVRSRWLNIGQVPLLHFFMDQDEVKVCKNAKREQGQYPAILTELAWSIKYLLYGIKSTEKMIFILVYFQALKRKPVICK